ALVSLNLNLPAPTVVAEQVNKAFGTIYGKIEEEIAAFVPDVTTEKGRQAIASLAYKIARTKTGLDDAAANVTADQKAIIDAVNKERKQMREDLDKLKASVRAPLDAWELEEKRRQERVRDLSMRLNNIEIELVGLSSEDLAIKFREIEEMDIVSYDYGDDALNLNKMAGDALAIIAAEINNAEKREAEAAELEQLRREKAEREAKEAAEREAEEARKREAERKEREAHEAAEREAERARIAQEAAEAAKREAEEKIAAAEKAAADAEAARVAAIEDARRRDIENEERREREAEEAKRREEENTRLSEQFAQEAARRAAEAERQRIESERLAQEEAEQKRAADLEHRKRINIVAANAMIKAGEITEQQAKAIVAAIFKGQVPNVAITY
ncbi:MAG TPA: hypothetical protein VJM50_21730, partial [Pyrinomonadaceae bacterium]|nr:hypothetical protein [Pyrinomonadaceae bacterium]